MFVECHEKQHKKRFLKLKGTPYDSVLALKNTKPRITFLAGSFSSSNSEPVVYILSC